MDQMEDHKILFYVKNGREYDIEQDMTIEKNLCAQTKLVC